MKRILALFAVCAFVLTACQPDPVLTLDKESIDFSADGGTQLIHVTSNYAWNAMTEGSDLTVSPTGGAESADVSITVNPNETAANKSWSVIFVCSNKDMSITKILTVTQTCPLGQIEFSSVEFDPTLINEKISPEGGIVRMTIDSNAPWSISCDQADVDLDLLSGPAGVSQVTASIPPCPVFEGRDITFSLTCATAAGEGRSNLMVSQHGGVVVYGGEVYWAVLMGDGKWWMTENLRYIPAGMTPSDDKNAVNNGIWYPLVIDELNEDKAPVKFSTAAFDIQANGYLYSTEVALGLKPGEITADNAGSFEGVQGICPSGWHIPTKADIVGLVGKTADKNDTDPTAPYYDANLNGGNGSVELLNGDGWNANAWGAIAIGNAAATTGSTMGAIKAYQKGMNTGYIAGSTMRQVTKNDDGTLKNVQFVAFMPNMNNGTFNGAWNNYRNGVSVRCVKNN